MAQRGYVSQLQNHVARQLPLNIEIEVVDIRDGIVFWIGTEIQFSIIGPIEHRTGRGINVREGIRRDLPSRDIHKRVGEGGSGRRNRRLQRNS